MPSFYFPTDWEQASQLTFIFFRGVETTNQISNKYIYIYLLYISYYPYLERIPIVNNRGLTFAPAPIPGHTVKTMDMSSVGPHNAVTGWKGLGKMMVEPVAIPQECHLHIPRPASPSPILERVLYAISKPSPVMLGSWHRVWPHFWRLGSWILLDNLQTHGQDVQDSKGCGRDPGSLAILPAHSRGGRGSVPYFLFPRDGRNQEACNSS